MSSSEKIRTPKAPQDPPPYTGPSSSTAFPPASPTPSRTNHSIADLRAQIIANASLINPRNSGEWRLPEDNLEVVVAKVTSAGIDAFNARLNYGVYGKRPAWEMQPEEVGMYRAMLCVKGLAGSKNSVIVSLKGEPRSSVLEALEWMLEETTRLVDVACMQYWK